MEQDLSRGENPRYLAKLQADAIAKLHRCGIDDRDDLVIRAIESGLWFNVEGLLEIDDKNITKSMLPESLFSD